MAQMAAYLWLGQPLPGLIADPLGVLVVMPRAAQPVTFDEVKAATPDYYPEPTYETKPEDFGRLTAACSLWISMRRRNGGYTATERAATCRGIALNDRFGSNIAHQVT